MLQLGACAQELFWSTRVYSTLEKPVPTLHTQEKALVAQVDYGSEKDPPIVSGGSCAAPGSAAGFEHPTAPASC